MRQRFRVLLAAWLLALPAAAMAGERLQVPRPAGWQALPLHSAPGVEMDELVPEGETAETWTRRITVQAYRGTDLTVPAFLDLVARNTAAICDAAAAEPPRLGRLGELEAGSRFVGCGRAQADGSGLYALYYAIRGRQALYVVIRAWRGAPFPAGQVPVAATERADWVAFMRAVSVCDPARAGCYQLGSPRDPT